MMSYRIINQKKKGEGSEEPSPDFGDIPLDI